MLRWAGGLRTVRKAGEELGGRGAEGPSGRGAEEMRVRELRTSRNKRFIGLKEGCSRLRVQPGLKVKGSEFRDRRLRIERLRCWEPKVRILDPSLNSKPRDPETPDPQPLDPFAICKSL